MTETPSPIPLWPAGVVPGAHGLAEPDVPSLTPFLAPGGGPRAAVVICPGGAYAGLAPHEGAPVARWLRGLGIHAFVLRYRVTPYRHPHPLLDAQRALRTVRERAQQWGVDPSRVGILGFSAGGHLASTAGTHFDAGDPGAADTVERQGCRPDFMILCYPVISFIEFPHQGTMANLIGADPPEDLRALLSNERQVTRDTPPAFLWHTADDGGVSVRNSLSFASALSQHGVPFALHVYGHGRHGLGLAENDADVGSWPTRCGAWLAQRGLVASDGPAGNAGNA